MDHRLYLAGQTPRGTDAYPRTIPQWEFLEPPRRAAGGGRWAAAAGVAQPAAKAGSSSNFALWLGFLGSRLYFSCGIFPWSPTINRNPQTSSLLITNPMGRAKEGEMEPRDSVTTCKLLAQYLGNFYTQSRPAPYKRHEDGSEGLPRGSQPQEEQGPHLPAQPQGPRSRARLRAVTLTASHPNQTFAGCSSRKRKLSGSWEACTDDAPGVPQTLKWLKTRWLILITYKTWSENYFSSWLQYLKRLSTSSCHRSFLCPSRLLRSASLVTLGTVGGSPGSPRGALQRSQAACFRQWGTGKALGSVFSATRKPRWKTVLKGGEAAGCVMSTMLAEPQESEVGRLS